jgi:hypothetical protein
MATIMSPLARLVLLLALLTTTLGSGVYVKLMTYTTTTPATAVGNESFPLYPLNASGGATVVGCHNLNPGVSYQSGYFYHASSSGQYNCSWVMFYKEANCQRQMDASGDYVGYDISFVNLVGGTTDAASKNFSSQPYLKNITISKSVGCSFTPDPCVAFPCSDPNAQCISSNITFYGTGGTLVTANNTRDCSTCKPGYVVINGLCTNVTKSNPCMGYTCPAGQICKYNTGAPYCGCNPSFYKDPKNSSNCISNWLPATNNVRAANNVPALTQQEYDSTIASQAASWASSLAANRCTGDCSSVSLSDDKNTMGYSQNTAYTEPPISEAGVVDFWAPVPTNTSDLHVYRMIQANQMGCGEAPCCFGRLYVCFYLPYTV